MITEYIESSDSFVICSRTGTPVLFVDADAMQSLLESAQLSVANRLAIKRKATI